MTYLGGVVMTLMSGFAAWGYDASHKGIWLYLAVALGLQSLGVFITASREAEGRG